MESGNFTCWANWLDALRKALNSPFQFYISCLIFLGTDASAWAQHISSSPFLFESFRGKSVFDIAFCHPISWLCALYKLQPHLYFFSQKCTYVQKSLSQNKTTKITFLLCDEPFNYSKVTFQLLSRRCPFLISVRYYIVLTDKFYGFSTFCKNVSLAHRLQLRIVQFLSFSPDCVRFVIREINWHIHN